MFTTKDHLKLFDAITENLNLKKENYKKLIDEIKFKLEEDNSINITIHKKNIGNIKFSEFNKIFLQFMKKKKFTVIKIPTNNELLFADHNGSVEYHFKNN